MYSKLKKIGLATIIVTSLVINTKIYAAVSIVPSKDGTGKDCMVNTTISNSFLLCRGMKDPGETLEGTTVDPHLATNTDWGAVSYLSNSTYGTNTEGKDTGIQVNIEGVNYYSTNGNETGVMNFGKNPNEIRYTQTSGIIKNYDNDKFEGRENVKAIFENINGVYVEIINRENCKGMAMQETLGIYKSSEYLGNKNDYPISLRDGIFGFGIGSWDIGYYYKGNGKAYKDITFRPVIWNN